MAEASKKTSSWRLGRPPQILYRRATRICTTYGVRVKSKRNEKGSVSWCRCAEPASGPRDWGTVVAGHTHPAPDPVRQVPSLRDATGPTPHEVYSLRLNNLCSLPLQSTYGVPPCPEMPSLEENVTEVPSDALNAALKQAPKLVAPEPEHCPGPESEEAGKGDACAGCPNQQICATTPKGPDPDIPIITERLRGVRHKILVLSGKGGVGKSTVSAMLAQAFSSLIRRTSDPSSGSKNKSNRHEVGENDRGAHLMQEAPHQEIIVGLMDTDLCGPSIPRMLLGDASTTGTIHTTSTGWSPLWASDSLAVMSIQFMLPDQDSAVIWRGPKKNGLIKRFLKDVEWGDLDLLVVDTPPGTSDEHLSVNSFLSASGVDGAVLVTTPQEVALLDVRKELDFCRKAAIPVIGVVENMAGFVCPNCKGESEIFRPTTGGARRMCEDENVPFLGSVPLDPRIGMACDYGESFLEAFPESSAARRYMEIVKRVGEVIGLEGAQPGENEA